MSMALSVAGHAGPVAFAPVIDPFVLIQFPPEGRRYEDFEVADGADGPHPCAVVRSVLRALDIGPDHLSAEPDDEASRACYLLDRMDRRIARLLGVDADAVNDAIAALFVARWAPGRNAEQGLHP